MTISISTHVLDTERGRPAVIPDEFAAAVRGWIDEDLEQLKALDSLVVGDLSDLDVREASFGPTLAVEDVADLGPAHRAAAVAERCLVGAFGSEQVLLCGSRIGPSKPAGSVSNCRLRGDRRLASLAGPPRLLPGGPE